MTGMTHLSAVSGSQRRDRARSGPRGCAGLLGLRRRWRPPLARRCCSRSSSSPVRSPASSEPPRWARRVARPEHLGAPAGIPVLSVAVLVLLGGTRGWPGPPASPCRPWRPSGLLLFTRPWGAAIGRGCRDGSRLGAGPRRPGGRPGDVRAGDRAAAGLGLRGRGRREPARRPIRRRPPRSRGGHRAVSVGRRATAAGWVAWLAACRHSPSPGSPAPPRTRRAARALARTGARRGAAGGGRPCSLVVAGRWLGHHARRRPILPVLSSRCSASVRRVPTPAVTWPPAGGGSSPATSGRVTGWCSRPAPAARSSSTPGRTRPASTPA